MSSLRHGARTMAVGTAASRGTGFLRTAVLAAVLGVAGVGDAFNVANTAPNIVYELLLGGLLSSVVVPLLVRAHKQGQGQAYAQRLLTLTVLTLGSASVLLVLLAPALVGAYSNSETSAETQDLAVVLARFFLPQVLFYGAGAVMGAYLNTRGRFGPPVWAPVLNNLIVIVTGLVFLLMPGPDALTPGTITDAQIRVLGIGVTLGIVAQTAVLMPALAAAGFRFRIRLDVRGTGLGHAASLAKWVVLYVLANQLAYLVVVRLATGAPPGRSYSSYVYAFVLWQLPHAIVAVSVITALLPRMSSFAADGRLSEMRQTLSAGLRLTIAVLVPAAVGYLVLGRAIATLVFAHGEVSIEQARFIGALLGIFSVGLVAFSAYQLQLRAFYAMTDTRTPTLVNLWVNGSAVLLNVLLVWLLPDRWEVAGLAAGYAASYFVGLVVVTRALIRATHASGGRSILRTAVRCTFAVIPAGGLALLVVALIEAAFGQALLAAALTVLIGGTVLVGTYLVMVRLVHVPEVDQVLRPVLSRLRRRPASPIL